MVLSREEQRRREALEKELREAEKLYNERRLVIVDQIESRRRACTREGTDKVSVVHREFQVQKEIAEKWLDRARKQVENEFGGKLAALSQEKTRLCQMIEQEIAQAVQVIEADEREALAVLGAEWEAARKRYRDALEPPTEPVVPAESETKRGEAN